MSAVHLGTSIPGVRLVRSFVRSFRRTDVKLSDGPKKSRRKEISTKNFARKFLAPFDQGKFKSPPVAGENLVRRRRRRLFVLDDDECSSSMTTNVCPRRRRRMFVLDDNDCSSSMTKIVRPRRRKVYRQPF